jgi:hypothetical protein
MLQDPRLGSFNEAAMLRGNSGKAEITFLKLRAFFLLPPVRSDVHSLIKLE